MSQFFSEILNLEGHLNCITGSVVTAVLFNGWILPIGGASAVEGLLSTGPTPSSLNGSCIDSGKALFRRNNSALPKPP